MPQNTNGPGVKPGDFPFPIVEGPEESPYLIWVRNHSNYMAVRGLLDYVRAAGVLLRGILVNFLVILPYLLLAGLAVAMAHLFKPSTFNFTEYTLIGAMVCVLIFPLLTTLHRVARHRIRLKTGSDSSVYSRDRYERTYGAILMIVAAVALFESLSVFLFPFHQLIYEKELGWSFVSIGAVATAAFAGADKLLSALGGAASKLALIAIGILGLFLPVLVVLLVADFLVFSPPSANWNAWIQPLAFIALALVGLTFILGVATFSFTVRDLLKLLVLLCVCLGLVATTIWTHNIATSQKIRFESALHASLFSLANPPEDFENEGQTTAKESAHIFKEEVSRFVQSSIERPGPKLQALSDYLIWYVNELGYEGDPFSEDPDSAADFTPMAVERPVFQSQRLQEMVDLTIDVYELIGLTDFIDILDVLDVAYEIDSAEFDDAAIEFALHFEIYNLTARLQNVKAVLQSTMPSAIASENLDENGDPIAVPVKKQTVNEALVNALFESALVSDGSSSINQQAQIDAYFESVDAQFQNTEIDCFDQPDAPSCGSMPFPTEFSALSQIAPLVNTEILLNEVEPYMAEARSELSIAANYSRTLYPEIYRSADALQAHITGLTVKGAYLLMFTALLWFLTWLTVDINQTSIHGLYRDRLASAFLVGEDTKGDIAIEKDLDLAEIGCREAGSTAPYHLINVALNLQGSKDISIRDRKSDFFIFSKKFTGGQRTGYCRSESMNYVCPQMGLATAMAISAAAASPNMGKSTSPALVAILTLLNIRLGYWIPNPGRLEQWLDVHKGEGDKKGAYEFSDVFNEEMREVALRWENLPNYSGRQLHSAEGEAVQPVVQNGLLGIAYSGGGIRSATVNLGITQALNHHGVFNHIDYMSTVSGGGYLGSSLSALMRNKTPTVCRLAGQVSLSESDEGMKVISIAPPRGERVSYQFAPTAQAAVYDGEKIKPGYRLLNLGPPPSKEQSSLNTLFSWRVRPRALLREFLGKLDETHRWVNVSDGGHIENLAGIELLRRRCKYIILGDGEADPHHHFNGLATLIRLARIDLGISIDIDLNELRLGENGCTQAHWAGGKIHYPGASEPGYLLYLKSSLTGDEDEVIQEYRHEHTSFPHQSTADQFFGEGQFEAYRSLGQHIAEAALQAANTPTKTHSHEQFSDFEVWFKALCGDGEDATTTEA